MTLEENIITSLKKMRRHFNHAVNPITADFYPSLCHPCTEDVDGFGTISIDGSGNVIINGSDFTIEMRNFDYSDVTIMIYYLIKGFKLIQKGKKESGYQIIKNVYNVCVELNTEADEYAA